MYPDLSYFFHDLFGTSYDNWISIFKTFGFMLAVAFLGSAYVLRLELIRKEKQGLILPFEKTIEESKNNILISILNTIVAFIFGFKFAYIINNFPEFKHDPAEVLISSSGSLLWGIILALLSILYSIFVAKVFEKRSAYKKIVHPYELTGDITIIAAISGLIGSRLFSVFENMDLFFKDPFGQLFSGSGLTIYGGLILAYFVVYNYVKKNGIKPIHMMDMAALSVVVGYGIGRLGCHFAGDGDWGIVNEHIKPSWFILPDWLWSYNYPHNVTNQGIPIDGCQALYCKQLIPMVYPTPLYEVIAMVVIFIFLWSIRKKINIPGMIFFIYMVLQGIERFLIEIIRVNQRYSIFGFYPSQAQIISIIFFLIGIGGIIYLNRTSKKLVINE